MPRTLDGLEALPADFVWGVATSAYQIEGGATEDGRGPSIWDTFSHTPGKTRNGDTGDIACAHRELWESDLDLIHDLGIPAYRLSLSWTRLQPTGEGELEPRGIAFYRALLERMREGGITPYVTLYHWDLPQALEDRGGWTNRATAQLFADYVDRVMVALGDLADDWITVNEPWCAAFLGYAYGAHAPGRTDPVAAVAAGHHLNLAHGLATQRIRARRPEARVAVTNIVADLVPASDSAEDLAAVERLDAVNHGFFLAPVFQGRYPDAAHAVLDRFGLAELIQPGDLETIAQPLDRVGVNHYQRVIVSDGPGQGLADAREVPAGAARTSFDWSITPDALAAVVQHVAREYTDLPILITESGASFHDYVDPEGRVNDHDRVAYLEGYLGALAGAVAGGVNVAGYFAWSLLDNFEWGEGYDKRFGLVYVDFGTQRRIPKLSAHWYSRLIADHAAVAREGALPTSLPA